MPSVVIKIKPYLQEFIRYSIADPITSSRLNLVGAAIVPFLEKMPKGAMPRLNNCDENMEIDLMYLNRVDGFDINGKLFISEENSRHIERIIENYFSDLFYQYCDDKIRYDLLINGKRVNKGQVKNVIIQFCYENRVPFNNLTYEMLKKRYYRRSIKKQKLWTGFARSAILFLV